MIFCLGEGKYQSEGEGFQKNNRVFNVQVTTEKFERIKNKLPKIKLPICTWIDGEKMIGGFLKVLNYQEAWKEYWKKAKEEDKKSITNIEFFDKNIFEKITGINIEDNSLSGKKWKLS